MHGSKAGRTNERRAAAPEALTPPRGDGAQRREAWVRDRLDALALYQHHARVNARRYVQGGSPERPFRVA